MGSRFFFQCDHHQHRLPWGVPLATSPRHAHAALYLILLSAFHNIVSPHPVHPQLSFVAGAWCTTAVSMAQLSRCPGMCCCPWLCWQRQSAGQRGSGWVAGAGGGPPLPRPLQDPQVWTASREYMGPGGTFFLAGEGTQKHLSILRCMGSKCLLGQGDTLVHTLMTWFAHRRTCAVLWCRVVVRCGMPWYRCPGSVGCCFLWWGAALCHSLSHRAPRHRGFLRQGTLYH